MHKIVKKMSIGLLALLISGPVLAASFMIDPYLGYKIITDGEAGTTEYDSKGAVFGSRFGLSQLGFMGGIDFSISSFDLESTTDNGNGTTSETSTNATDFGLFLGYEAPILLRAWATYFINSSYEYGEGSIDGDKLNGSGYALGVGYTGLPFLSLNLEYRNKTMDEYEDYSNGTTTNLSGDTEVSFSEILLSVSLPLSF